jgi:hypothetical protein
MISRTCVSLLVVAGLSVLAGCAPNLSDVAVRPEFKTIDKVAIWPTQKPDAEGGLVRLYEELFIPRWMAAFPKQEVFERRDTRVPIGEQDILPSRLDDETRAEIRRLHGVKGIIFPNYSVTDWCQVHIKVIDTATGEIVASITRRRKLEKDRSANALADELIRCAVADLAHASLSPPQKAAE